MRKTYLFLMVFGWFVWANSSFQDWTMGYGIFNVFDLHKIKGASVLFELMLLLVTLIFSIIIKNKSHLIGGKGNNIIFVVLVVLAVISVMVSTNEVFRGVRTIVRYLQPLGYFVLLSRVSWEKNDIVFYLRILGFFLFIIIMVGFYQWIVLGFTVDHLHSMVDNAHIFGLIMWYSIIYLITKYWFFHKKIYLIMIIFPLSLAAVSSNDKATLISIVTLIVSYLYLRRMSLKNIILGFFIFIIVSFSAILVFNSLGDRAKTEIGGGLDRLSYLTSGGSLTKFIESTSQYRAYASIPDIYLENSYNALIGVGPTNFGSREVDLTSKYSKIVFKTDDVLLLGSDIFRFGSSDILVLLLEFGVLYSVLFFAIFRKIYLLTIKFHITSIDFYYRHLLFWLLNYLIVVSIISFISFREGISNTTNTIPYFILLGMLCSIIDNQESDHLYIKDDLKELRKS